MHRFIISSVPAEKSTVWLDAKESHHARNVLRVKEGESVEVLDGLGGKFQAVVAGFEEGRVGLLVGRRSEEKAQRLLITLAPAVIKPERMEWMLEKACELGIAEWRPILTERNAVQLSRERWVSKTERWRKIARESCKQCGQARIPVLNEPILFKDLLAQKEEFDAIWIPTLEVPGEDLRSAMVKTPHAQKVLVLIGPEGDFTQKEVQKAVSLGAKAVTLGPRVLRAETAALYLLSAAQFFYGSSDGKRD